MSAAVSIGTQYSADLATLEEHVREELDPARRQAAQQIAAIGAEAHVPSLLEPARQLVAYVDGVRALLARARLGEADPDALHTMAEAVRSLTTRSRP